MISDEAETMNRKLLHITLLLLFFCLGLPAFSQDTLKQVTGIVKGINNDPVPGVAVSLEGILTEPVITDSTGSFSISVPSGDVYILLSPSGKYKNKRIYLNRRFTIETTLNPLDINDGQDLATHIFYNQKKGDFASSASFLAEIFASASSVSSTAVNTTKHSFTVCFTFFTSSADLIAFFVGSKLM